VFYSYTYGGKKGHIGTGFHAVYSMLPFYTRIILLVCFHSAQIGMVGIWKYEAAVNAEAAQGYLLADARTAILLAQLMASRS
jgi:hypothetical protein